ncbi:hypothetical protein MHYP_G00127530 [Metynnis hypsauchen]
MASTRAMTCSLFGSEHPQSSLRAMSTAQRFLSVPRSGCAVRLRSWRAAEHQLSPLRLKRDVFESSEEVGEREKEGPSEGNAEELLSEDPGLWPDKLTAQQRETLVCRLASESVDLTKVAPKDKEGKAFPDYLQYVKSANGQQNVLLVRYVHHDKEDSGVWKIVERFIEFKDFHKKTGQEISEMILEALQSNGIPLQECRGQGYDNGANMSGKVKGVQALYKPCASHTLNLVGVHAAESCPEVATFFGSVNRLYNFFSASPERWATLKEKTGCSLHRLSDTQWSARIAAVRVVAAHLPSILEALECVLATCSLTSEAKSEANGLIGYFKTFDAIVLLTVWVKILQCIENRNVILQAGDISLDVEAANIKALQEEMQAFRS